MRWALFTALRWVFFSGSYSALANAEEMAGYMILKLKGD
jgi:hypothetical protein